MRARAHRLRLLGLALVVQAIAMPQSSAQLRLGTPEVVNAIQRGTGDTESGCGLSADFAFPDLILRVEIMGWKREAGAAFAIRTFSPQSVSPAMRDIWLKTPTYFTLGLFKHAKMTTKGFLESQGSLDAAGARKLFNELSDGGAEISFVFDGPLPHSRVPVALPRPLPGDVTANFVACADGLIGK